MIRKIDSKYEIVLDTGCEAKAEDYIESIKIRNRFNGNEIPENEPTFIFRARDQYAFATLNTYLNICIRDGCSKEQLDGIRHMISLFDKFRRFAHDNPDKMKQPGSTMPEDMKRNFGKANKTKD